MLYKVFAKDIPTMKNEMHYAFHEGIPKNEYPQMHDFYEFTLVTEGAFTIIVDGVPSTISEGDIILIKPGSIHSKLSIPHILSFHINLAIYASTMKELVAYLFQEENLDCLRSGKIIHLSKNEKTSLQSDMMFLNLFSESAIIQKRAYLKQLLIRIIYDYFIPNDNEELTRMIMPQWLEQVIKQLQNPDNLYEGVPFLIKNTGKTKEHVCRSFKKYLGVTPVQYINSMRLTYVANMLKHSNREITDLCEDVGFTSLSYLYALFRKAYGQTLRQYRKTHQVRQYT